MFPSTIVYQFLVQNAHDVSPSTVPSSFSYRRHMICFRALYLPVPHTEGTRCVSEHYSLPVSRTECTRYISEHCIYQFLEQKAHDVFPSTIGYQFFVQNAHDIFPNTITTSFSYRSLRMPQGCDYLGAGLARSCSSVFFRGFVLMSCLSVQVMDFDWGFSLKTVGRISIFVLISHLLHWHTNSTEPSPFSEADSRLAGQKFPAFYRTRRFVIAVS